MDIYEGSSRVNRFLRREVFEEYDSASGDGEQLSFTCDDWWQSQLLFNQKIIEYPFLEND